MGNVGLLYVGAVLFINGLMLIGVVSGKSAAVMNFFVGGMQVIFPTLIIAQSGGDTTIIFGAAGLYLFGFTYLYVGFNQIFGLSGEGLGWFSLFVTVCALVIGTLQFTALADPVFGAIWYLWAVLWFLFFLLLGLGMESIGVFTGWFTIVVAHVTGTIPALLLLSGAFAPTVSGAVAVGIGAVVAVLVAAIMAKRARGIEASHTPSEAVVG
ncbi:AmiS/UreI family transporter [Arthrobacter rhombi]|uniref:AmiS/UreI family transporter n=1 Tax=Arthrobacter rhombi TaxID=71253 RepID=UPI003FD10B58